MKMETDKTERQRNETFIVYELVFVGSKSRVYQGSKKKKRQWGKQKNKKQNKTKKNYKRKKGGGEG